MTKRRSKKIAPGVRLTVTKRGPGISAHIPGTGISVSSKRGLTVGGRKVGGRKKSAPRGTKAERNYWAAQRRKKSPTLGCLFGILPGFGQFYTGQWLKGTIILLTSWLIIPWLYGMVDAYVYAKKYNAALDHLAAHNALVD